MCSTALSVGPPEKEILRNSLRSCPLNSNVELSKKVNLLLVLFRSRARASCGELDAQPSPPDEGVMTFLRKKVKTGAVVGKRVLLQVIMLNFEGWKLDGYQADGRSCVVLKMVLVGQVCSFMPCDLDFEPLSLSLSPLPSSDLVSLTNILILCLILKASNQS
ncbi:hypothetical protein Tco_1122237 [Tanacetum coccineum]|uniref:Uncharacterized protein n=1 Tax=Tanacetum coccineum TaxID=301880 RepID=A0ABQ5J2A2_9ASTR